MSVEANKAAWVAELPQLVMTLAERWQLRCDGSPWSGFMSTVWPVVGPGNEPLALKVSWPEVGSRAEPVALRAWAGRAVVSLRAEDEISGAMLLQRLNGDRTLQEHPSIDDACTVIGEILASLTSVIAPVGIPPLEEEVQRIADSIAMNQATHPNALPSILVSRARATLSDLMRDLEAMPQRQLIHGDCHFLNVLHTLPTDVAQWVAIDPLPAAGLREWDVTALLRNRWDDARATANPDSALRRRVDLVSDIAMMNRSLVRAIAQAVAVDNLLWLLPREPQHMFVAPYRVIAHWQS